MNLSNSWYNIVNGTIWTGLKPWLCADVAFYLEFINNYETDVSTKGYDSGGVGFLPTC